MLENFAPICISQIYCQNNKNHLMRLFLMTYFFLRTGTVIAQTVGYKKYNLLQQSPKD